MKKAILPLLAVLALAFSFSSCEHQTMRTAEVTIYPWVDYSTHWVTNNNVSYYYCTIHWDELTPDVVDYGLVNAYLVNKETGIQDMLPLVTPITYIGLFDANGDGFVDDNDVYTTPENIRFDVRYGEITFIIQDLDGELPDDMANTLPLTFRIVAIGD